MSRWESEKILILGHRGFKQKYPENTVLSFLEAVMHGADGIELDVWLTKDEKLVIAHDEDFKRVADVARKIKDSTLADLKKIDLGMGQNVPTLSEIFDSMPEKTLINVEIKDIDIVEKVIALIEKYRIEDRIMVSSFNIDALRKVREINKNIILGLLIEDEKIIPRVPELARELNLYSVNIPIDALDIFTLEQFKQAILQFKALGLHIVIWADRDALFYKDNNILKIAPLVDIVITDDVERMRSLLS